MNVLALTIFVSSILAGMFVLLWVVSACTPHSFSDRDALLPLEDDYDVEAALSRSDVPPPSTPQSASSDARRPLS